jgi:hypothetical protein
MRLLLAAVTAATLASTGAGAVSLIPLSENPGGQSPAVSAEQWLKWASSFDTIVDGGDPISDTTGSMQTLKQTYPVFLLGGTFGGEATRSLTAPAGSIFMVPLLNVFCTGGNPDAPPGFVAPCDEAVAAVVRTELDDVQQLFLRIDGKTIYDADTIDEVDLIEAALRIESGIFSLELAPNSFWNSPELTLPAGTYDSNFIHGFFAFVKLGSGVHTIEYGGGFDSDILGNFSNSIVATITLAPIPLPAALPLLTAGVGALGLAARRRRVPA